MHGQLVPEIILRCEISKKKKPKKILQYFKNKRRNQRRIDTLFAPLAIIYNIGYRM